MIACFYCVPFILGGCNGSPEAVSKLAIDPTDAAAAAFELYDKNSDRILSKDEIEACRGLAASVKAFDENRDGEISVEELENRIDFWVNCPARMVSIMCTVKMDGRPLSGATVRFVPEPFLADGQQVLGLPPGGRGARRHPAFGHQARRRSGAAQHHRRDNQCRGEDECPRCQGTGSW